MKKRILSIICIMFLLFTICSPLTGSVFTYADEPQQEQLSQDEVIKAAIALYLNERKAWITSTTSAPIDAVQAQMQIWIDSYDFWTNHTTIGSAAEFYAKCVVKYNPFRISLKGPAVRALNDLYNWLIDSGKLPNLESDEQGGETSDSLYSGKLIGNYLFFVVKNNATVIEATQDGYTLYSESDVQIGSPVRGITSEMLYNKYMEGKDFDFDDTSVNNYSSPTYGTVTYAANTEINLKLQRQNGTSAKRPVLLAQVGSYPYTYGYLWANRVQVIRGVPAWYLILDNGANNVYYGFASYNATLGGYSFTQAGIYNRPSDVNDASVNFETDNFNKTDPTPPEGDDEVTYTPEDKTTGNTYNTYNEYITNYVTKNTVVNNNNSGGGDDPYNPSGGTTPPWDGSNAGTLTPDGNGGYNFNLPDLTLPDLDINWNISGLTEKFPFSIPWDLMAFFTVLNAEPETPSIQATIDLGIVDWDIDWDLHNFDTLAVILRNLEFIGFCLALILITRSIIKG